MSAVLFEQFKKYIFSIIIAVVELHIILSCLDITWVI